MRKYSTAECPDATSKIALWRELCAEHFDDLEFSPIGESPFDSELSWTDVGALRLIHSRSMPARVGRSKARATRQATDAYYIHVQLEGAIVCAHGRGDVHLAPGDFVLCHSAEPYWFHIRAPARTLIVSVPGPQLRAYIPAPQNVLGRRFRGDVGVGALAAQLITNLWSRSRDLEGASEEVTARLGGNVLDILSTALAEARGISAGETSGGAARRAQIRSCIEQNLRNPSFGVADVASRVGISERYARKLFEPEGETICALLLRRRLEECAKQLRNPSQRCQSITDIAFTFGFSSSTYFATAFKAKYGMTPSQFRHGALGAGTGAAERTAPDLAECRRLPKREQLVPNCESQVVATHVTV